VIVMNLFERWLDSELERGFATVNEKRAPSVPRYWALIGTEQRRSVPVQRRSAASLGVRTAAALLLGSAAVTGGVTLKAVETGTANPFVWHQPAPPPAQPCALAGPCDGVEQPNDAQPVRREPTGLSAPAAASGTSTAQASTSSAASASTADQSTAESTSTTTSDAQPSTASSAQSSAQTSSPSATQPAPTPQVQSGPPTGQPHGRPTSSPHPNAASGAGGQPVHS
jgi:hypothetical protein